MLEPTPLPIVPSWRRSSAFLFLAISDVHVDERDETLEHRAGRVTRDVVNAWRDFQSYSSGDVIGGILVVGDLTKKSGRSEFSLFQERVLRPLMVATSIGRERVFAVPGNHDHLRSVIDRDDKRHPKNVRVESGEDGRLAMCARGALWEERIGSRFYLYHEWATQNSAKVCIDRTAGPWRVEVSSPPEQVGFGLDVVGLNSAIASNGHGSENGDDDDLWIHDSQARQVIAPQLSPNQVQLVLMHHPPDLLDSRDGEAKALLLGRPGVVVHGHVHRRGSIPGSERRPVVVVAPSLGNPDARDDGSPNHKDGCAILRIEKERVQVFYYSHAPPRGSRPMLMKCRRSPDGIPVPDVDEPIGPVPRISEVS